MVMDDLTRDLPNFALVILDCYSFLTQNSFDLFQELIAYGAGNFVGSFFSCFPICNALARSVVQENLASTQVMLTSGTKAIGAFEIGRVLCVGCLYGAPDNDEKLDNCP